MSDKIGEGKDPEGKKVEIYQEGGLVVARAQNGEKLSHSDTWEGLVEAKFDIKKDGSEEPKKEEPKKHQKKK